MRLFNVRSQKLEYFVDRPPAFAILSHTWEDDEVLFEDLKGPPSYYVKKRGYKKIEYSCNQAAQDGFGYIWIDTLCIDKSSSAELSEAINSMFMWYRVSKICYAYLCDMDAQEADPDFQQRLRDCRWFARGWTLQELIAPSQVLFFDKTWTYLGKRAPDEESYPSVLPRWKTPILGEVLSRITGIAPVLLNHRDKVTYDSKLCSDETHRFVHRECFHCGFVDTLPDILALFSISQRMNWAARRSTTRLEDEAYCLLGLFQVNMPLLYGEGHRAFLRLQEEILKSSNDQSILVFRRPIVPPSLLASSPSQFAEEATDSSVSQAGSPRGMVDIHHLGYVGAQMWLTPKTLDMEIYLCELGSTSNYRAYLGILDCAYQGDLSARAVIILGLVTESQNLYEIKFLGYRTINAVHTHIPQGSINSINEGPIYDLTTAQRKAVRILRVQTHTRFLGISSRVVQPALRILLGAQYQKIAYHPLPSRCFRSLPDDYIPSTRELWQSRASISGLHLCGVLAVQVGESEVKFCAWGLVFRRGQRGFESRSSRWRPWCRLLSRSEVLESFRSCNSHDDSLTTERVFEHIRDDHTAWWPERVERQDGVEITESMALGQRYCRLSIGITEHNDNLDHAMD